MLSVVFDTSTTFKYTITMNLHDTIKKADLAEN